MVALFNAAVGVDGELLWFVLFGTIGCFSDVGVGTVPLPFV